MYKTVFILGAGASADAGLPVMANFLDRARDYYSAGMLSEGEQLAFKSIFEAIHKLKGISFSSNLDLNNIETVFSALDMGRLIGRMGDIPNEEINNLYISIQRLIGTTIDLSTTLREVTDPENATLPNNTNFRINGSYPDFVGLLKNMFPGNNFQNVSIITFNYDVALEYAMFNSGIAAYYGLSNDDAAHKLPLFKLHGSVNWGTNAGGKLESWDIQNIPPGFAPIKIGDQYRLLVARYFYEGRTEVKLGLNGPAVVPPTWNKADHHDKLKIVWRKAARALAEAEAIYVIGYSLPETDMFFRYLFALATHSESSIRRFWVFDPTNSIKNRFLSLLGPGLKDEPRFSFESNYFSQALTTLSKDVDRLQWWSNEKPL